MSEAIINAPQFLDKRLFLLTDLQSRVKTIGPQPSTAFSLRLLQPQEFTRQNNELYYYNPQTGLLVPASNGLARHEVNGLCLEPEEVTNHLQASDDFNNTTYWTKVGGANCQVISDNGVGPTGESGVADVFRSVDGSQVELKQLIPQSEWDPGDERYSISIFVRWAEGEPRLSSYIDFDPFSVTYSGDNLDIVEADGWVRYDFVRYNTNPGQETATIGFRLQDKNGSSNPCAVYIWGAQTTSNYGVTFSYRPRLAGSTSVPQGVENLVYSLDAMGKLPDEDFTLYWDFIPLGNNLDLGDRSQALIGLGRDADNLMVAFGAYSELTEVGVFDNIAAPTVEEGFAHEFARYSHQRWAWKVSNGGDRVDVFVNGTKKGQLILTSPLSTTDIDRFIFPTAALHRRIELYDSLLDDALLEEITAV